MTRFDSMLTVLAFLLVMAGVLILVAIYAKAIAEPLGSRATRLGRISRKPPKDKGSDLSDQND